MKNQIMRFSVATAMLVLVGGCADDPEASRVLGKTLERASAPSPADT
jgi:hypothetical protein